MANWFSDVIGDITAHKFSGPGGKHNPQEGGPPPPSPTDMVLKYLNSYINPQTNEPVDAQSALKFLQVQDPKLFNKGEDPNKIAQAVGQYANYAGWRPEGATPQTSASVLDPLGVQMFFQQTIAPYLSQIAQDEKNVAGQYQAASTQTIPGLPASLNATLQSNAANMGRASQLAFDTTQAAALNQPRVDQLTQMLAAVQKAQLQNYYEGVRTGTSTTPATPPIGLG